MSKRIAILTLPLHHNFGGNLQAYALSETLKSLGHEVDVLNIQNKRQGNFFILKHYIKQYIKKIIVPHKVEFPLLESEKKKIYQHHKQFIKANMHLTKGIYDLKSLSEIVELNKYDAIVVGSDQVWRKAYTPDIETYFLNFLTNKKIKKIAYAASFGLEEWQYDDKTTKTLKGLAKNFDYISVRESNAVDLCKSYLDVDVDHVLDPTLLLSRDNYLKLIENIDSNSKGKIFSYILDQDDKKTQVIGSIKEKIGKEVSSIDILKAKKKPFLDNIETKITPRIEEWLANFRDADFIITDSFHGMVFSIIFNKEFIVLINKDRGAVRFTSLLNLLGLSNRIFTNHDFIENKINYDNVNLYLEKYIISIQQKINNKLGG